MAISSVIDFLKPDGPPMSEEEQKRAAKFIDQIDPVPANADRLTVAVIREAVAAIKEFYSVPADLIQGTPEYDDEKCKNLSKQKRCRIGSICQDALKAWKWIRQPKGAKFLLSFSACMAHNGTCYPEETRERTIEMLEKIGSKSHVAFLRGQRNEV